MPFSFFTKRSEYTSKRLRFVARGLQVWGVFGGIVTLLGALMLVSNQGLHWTDDVREQILRRQVIWAIGRSVSYFFIGQAMLRRQRWGAYVAILAMGIPAVTSTIFFAKQGLLFPIALGVLPIVGLVLVASVWRELGSIRDSDLADHGPPPEAAPPFTSRNRGYGESRSLPLQSMPDLPLGSLDANENLQRSRDHVSSDSAHTPS